MPTKNHYFTFYFILLLKSCFAILYIRLSLQSSLVVFGFENNLFAIQKILRIFAT